MGCFGKVWVKAPCGEAYCEVGAFELRFGASAEVFECFRRLRIFMHRTSLR
jgi:hypothetical protein